jgi:hypothetical protein
MPLVFQPVDFSALQLSTAQVQGISELRDRFIAELGGLNQDPNDPGYRERWLKIQPEMDKQLQGLIGLLSYRYYEVASRTRQANGAAP